MRMEGVARTVLAGTTKTKWDLGGWEGGDIQGEKLGVSEQSSNKTSQPN